MSHLTLKLHVTRCVNKELLLDCVPVHASTRVVIMTALCLFFAVGREQILLCK